MRWFRMIGFAAAATVVTGAAQAQETPSRTRLTSEHYFEMERINEPQISPDGKRILYVRQYVNQLEDKWDSSLWIMNADGSQNRFFTKGSNARWSPDGQRVLYLAEGDGGLPQVFVRWVEVEGPATQITHATDKLTDPRWSPDGSRIAFAMFVPDKPKWSISMPPEPKGAKWTAPPRIVEKLHYRQDQVGLIDDGSIHLFAAPSDGGALRQLTSGKWSVGAGELRGPLAFDWTPDGKSIVFPAARDFDADLSYERSQLLVVDVAAGAVRELVSAKGQWGLPKVSPDGKTVAFTGFPQSTKSHTVTDLYVVPLAGGDMRKISGDFDRDPIRLQWAADGSGVYFDADEGGSRNVNFASIKGGVRAVTSGAHILNLDSVSRSQIAVGTMSDPDHPAEVARYDLRKPGQLTQLTHANASFLEGKQLGKTQEITWTSTGGIKVQGWYITPPDFDSSKKYPLILLIRNFVLCLTLFFHQYLYLNHHQNNFYYFVVRNHKKIKYFF